MCNKSHTIEIRMYRSLDAMVGLTVLLAALAPTV